MAARDTHGLPDLEQADNVLAATSAAPERESGAYNETRAVPRWLKTAFVVITLTAAYVLGIFQTNFLECRSSGMSIGTTVKASLKGIWGHGFAKWHVN